MLFEFQNQNWSKKNNTYIPLHLLLAKNVSCNLNTTFYATVLFELKSFSDVQLLHKNTKKYTINKSKKCTYRLHSAQCTWGLNDQNPNAAKTPRDGHFLEAGTLKTEKKHFTQPLKIEPKTSRSLFKHQQCFNKLPFGLPMLLPRCSQMKLFAGFVFQLFTSETEICSEQAH